MDKVMRIDDAARQAVEGWPLEIHPGFLQRKADRACRCDHLAPLAFVRS
jgi:hypothetical protein